jgi:hypothetical protein
MAPPGERAPRGSAGEESSKVGLLSAVGGTWEVQGMSRYGFWWESPYLLIGVSAFIFFVAKSNGPRARAGAETRNMPSEALWAARGGCPTPHGPGCAFAEGRILPTRRVGEAAIRLGERLSRRPLQQARRIVRLPGAAATPARSYTHATPARQSRMSARRHIQSPPLSEVAFLLVCRFLYPGAFGLTACNS